MYLNLGIITDGLILGRRRDEALLDESVSHRDLAKGHPEGPAPHLEALDVEHGGLVLGEQQHDVLPGKKPLQTHLGLEVRPEKGNIKTPSNKITGPQRHCCKCSYDLK